VQLAVAGYRVGIHYHSNRGAAEETLRLLARDEHVLLAADLSVAEGAAILAEAALRELGGRIDVLINNAGVYLETPLLEEIKLEDWQASVRAQMQVNFFAGAELACLLAPGMAEGRWGRIIQIASRSGLQGEGRFSGYSASKAAQIAFTKSLARELAASGIGCFSVAPGWVATDMSAEAIARDGEAIRAGIPAGRVATPEDIAQLVGYLVTPAADYLTGNTIDVNGASYLR
ncbi:MAG: SDR family oxidoreductase, partial [Chthoniobacterales bacterium]|nr:SDR family oxidoreductase [Chthoniobacterales bacterium]